MGIEIFKKHLREKRAIKVSYRASLNNLENVAKFARAAQTARASAIDIPCDKQAFDMARKYSKLPLFASSIHPFEILNAVKYGVDAIEIGNFNNYYSKAQAYNAFQIYDIVLETLGLINDYDVFVSVTIPGYILIEDQVLLAKKLQLLGVDLIHIEGISVANRMYIKDDISTVANLPTIYENISTPIMASAVSTDIAKKLFSYGANAVDYDCLNPSSEVSTSNDIRKIVSSVFHRNSINSEIPRILREYSLN